jgi:hypothetical protein
LRRPARNRLSIQQAGAHVRSLFVEMRLGSNVALDDLHDLIFGYGSDELVRYLAALENKKRRYPANIELPRGVAVLIDVKLYNFQLPGVFARYLFHRRRKHMARAAPISPEIHHHRLGLTRFNHICFETRVRYCRYIICHLVSLSRRARPAVAQVFGATV